jgi:hypothetical protein
VLLEREDVCIQPISIKVAKVKKGETGKCPHCSTSVRFEATTLKSQAGSYGTTDPVVFATPSGHSLLLFTSGCPACGKPILLLGGEGDGAGQLTAKNELLWPDSGIRPVPQEVSAEAPELAADFLEATTVIAKSKKASAALSRRCLQFILTRKGGATKRDLADQIDEVLHRLPSELAHNVDAIRQIGNFAAHPMKSTTSGSIVDVEDGEAEWLLDVLEELFDYYYVAPAKAAARRTALNTKLKEMGKPQLKTPPK